MPFTRIAVDSREAPSGIPEILRKRGLYVQMKPLDVGDYVTGQYAVERKTVRDFIASLYSGRLFEQVRRISGSYKDYLLIVEGDIHDALVDLKNPKVFWGTLLSLAFDFGFRIFFTLDREQTADVLEVLTITPPGKASRVGPMLVKKPRMGTTKDWQLSILESLPGIGPKLGEQLLKSFGSVRRVFQASRAELAVKAGIGPATAERIQQLLDAQYRKEAGRQVELA